MKVIIEKFPTMEGKMLVVNKCIIRNVYKVEPVWEMEKFTALKVFAYDAVYTVEDVNGFQVMDE